MIPYGWHEIGEDEVAAVAAVLRGGLLTQGPEVPRFERGLAERCGAAEAVAANSATSALHMACLALGVGLGDRVWTSPNTFVASANCARYCGAEVDFVDIDTATGNMSAAALADKLAAAEQAGRLPKAVIPVHFAGQPCDMAEIAALGRRYDFRIIEDAAHALGAEYAGGRVGDGRYADITVLSFHPVKIITTGEGGAALTNDGALAHRMRLLRSHCTSRDSAELTDHSQGDWYYEQIGLGYNYRMTEVQAVLGIGQLARLDGFLARRRQLADRYDRLLAGLPVQPLARARNRQSAWHLYVVQVAPERRRAVFESMRARDIAVHVHYIPVCNQPYYRDLGFGAGTCPTADLYYASALTLPLFPGLTDAQQDYVAAALAVSLARLSSS